MPSLDVFRSDAFNLTTLTDGILKAPFKPSRLGQLGLFRERPVTTTSIMVEEKDGRLGLIQTSPRGAPATAIGEQKRTARSFIVPHLVKESNIMADEVQNVRAFGQENVEAAIQAIVAERLADLRSFHEVTLERHRASALQGIILDADGSTIYNLFTEFAVAQQTANISAGTDPRGDIIKACRLIETDLGAEPMTGYRALCGDTFFDTLTAATKVQAALQYQESIQLRQDLRRGFDFGGVTWENYRGSIGGTPFFAASEAYLFPEGTNLFETIFAPADFTETVNTMGLPIYAKIALDDDFQRWIKIHTQSNPLSLCLRPRAVVKLAMVA